MRSCAENTAKDYDADSQDDDRGEGPSGWSGVATVAVIATTAHLVGAGARTRSLTTAAVGATGFGDGIVVLNA